MAKEVCEGVVCGWGAMRCVRWCVSVCVVSGAVRWVGGGRLVGGLLCAHRESSLALLARTA